MHSNNCKYTYGNNHIYRVIETCLLVYVREPTEQTKKKKKKLSSDIKPITLNCCFINVLLYLTSSSTKFLNG